MNREELPQISIQNFESQFNKLIRGEAGLIAESDIKPVKSLTDAESLGNHYQTIGENHLSRSVFSFVQVGCYDCFQCFWRSSVMKRWWVIVLGLLTLLSAAAGLIIQHDHGHEKWWSRTPGFFIFFGFIGCVLLILLAKNLGKCFLLRDEDYYDDK